MDKKQLIIEQATHLFSEKGYYGMGLKELLDSCNIPKGSFYHYFPNGKKQLAMEVLENAYSSMESGIKKGSFSNPNIKDTFINMANTLAHKLQTDKKFQSLTMTFLAIESVYLDKDINDKCKDIYIRWQNLYIERFLQNGYNKDEATEKAQAIFALIHGSLITSWIKQDPGDLEIIKKAIIQIID